MKGRVVVHNGRKYLSAPIRLANAPVTWMWVLLGKELR
jgi:hypothetical protein